MSPRPSRRARLDARRALLPLLLPEAQAGAAAVPPASCWLDWACDQGVAAFLAARPEVRGAVDAAAGEVLDRYRWDAAFRYEDARSAARRIAAAAAEAGLDVLVLKGVGLAERYYPDPPLRPVNDLDLLVRERDRARAAALLEALGYAQVKEEASELGFAPREHGIPVELHWRLVNSASLRANLEEGDASLWETAEPLDLDGVPVRVPGPWDALQSGCVHAAHHHQFSRLVWLLDLRQQLRDLARRPGALEAGLASARGGERLALTAALRLVGQLFPAGVPLTPPDPLPGRPVASWCLGQLGPRAVLLPEAGATRWRRKLFREALKIHA